MCAVVPRHLGKGAAARPRCIPQLWRIRRHRALSAPVKRPPFHRDRVRLRSPPCTPMRKERSCPLPSQTRSGGPTVRRLDTRQGFRAPEPTTKGTCAAPGPRTMLFAHGGDEGRSRLSPSIPISGRENSLSPCTAIDERGTRSIRPFSPCTRIVSPLGSAQARTRLHRAPLRLRGLISARFRDFGRGSGRRNVR